MRSLNNNERFEVLPKLTLKYSIIDFFVILKVVNKFKPDIIHVCTSGLAFPVISRKYPVVIRAVGNDFLNPWLGGNLVLGFIVFRLPLRIKNYFEKYLKVYRKNRIREQFLACSKIITNSDWTLKELVKFGVPTNKINLIVGGYDQSLFYLQDDKALLRKILEIPDNSLLLLTACNLYRSKGIDNVLYAISRLIIDFPNLYYIVVGSGPELDKLENLAQSLFIKSHVRFVGKKDQAELSGFYRSADLYVQVSHQETMGRTFFEAGASGLAVIGSNIGGIPSVVKHGENGYLIENPSDIDDITNAIRHLLVNESERFRMAKAGSVLATSKFGWNMVMKDLNKIFISSISEFRVDKKSSFPPPWFKK
jgi:glycosyltransferase involved in cell wall biosynthesis